MCMCVVRNTYVIKVVNSRKDKNNEHITKSNKSASVTQISTCIRYEYKEPILVPITCLFALTYRCKVFKMFNMIKKKFG